MIRGIRPRRAVEPEYSVGGLHTLGPLERYEAATRRAREVLYQPAQGYKNAGQQTIALPKPDYTVPAVSVAEFGYDTEWINDGGSPHVVPEWLHLSLWVCGIAAITFLLVIASILVAEVASMVL